MAAQMQLEVILAAGIATRVFWSRKMPASTKEEMTVEKKLTWDQTQFWQFSYIRLAHRNELT